MNALDGVDHADNLLVRGGDTADDPARIHGRGVKQEHIRLWRDDVESREERVPGRQCLGLFPGHVKLGQFLGQTISPVLLPGEQVAGLDVELVDNEVLLDGRKPEHPLMEVDQLPAYLGLTEFLPGITVFQRQFLEGHRVCSGEKQENKRERYERRRRSSGASHLLFPLVHDSSSKEDGPG